MKKLMLLVVLAALLALPMVALAGDNDGVVQKVGHGEVNWTGKVITVTGSGSPNLKGGAVPAQLRLQTERAAELDAYRKILEIVKGVQVNSKQTIGAQMQASPEVSAKVEGLIKGMRRIDTKYYSDGGVDVIVQFPLDGSLTQAVIPSDTKPVAAEAPKVQAQAPGSQQYTGLVVDARGLKLVPALAPRIVDESGKELYDASKIDPVTLKSAGGIAYVLNVDSAKKNNRVTDNPLIIKAAKIAEGGKCDLVIAKEDAAKLDGKDFLNKGRVVVIVD